MKTRISIVLLVLVAIPLLSAQEGNSEFFIGEDSVQIYDYSRKITSTDLFLDDTFEDDYNLKITNKVYKIRLNFPSSREKEVQELASRILDGDAATNGFKTMVWKKNKDTKSEMYEVRITKGKLRFEIIRQYMDIASYELLTELGQTFIRTIKK